MNIDYKNYTVVKTITHFNGVTEDGREFIIQAVWTMDGWKIDLIIWINNDGDKESEFNIKTDFLYDITKNKTIYN